MKNEMNDERDIDFLSLMSMNVSAVARYGYEELGYISGRIDYYRKLLRGGNFTQQFLQSSLGKLGAIHSAIVQSDQREVASVERVEEANLWK